MKTNADYLEDFFHLVMKKEKRLPENKLVPILFGETDTVEMQKMFPDVALLINGRQMKQAQQLLLEYTARSDARIQICAWKELQKIGYHADKAIEKNVLGFILETGTENDVDYLAVYPDNTAHYFSNSDSKSFYEACDDGINKEIQTLLRYSQEVVRQIGVWKEPRRNPPKKGITRINFLTPMGLFFGEADTKVLEKDLLSKNVMAQAAVVIQWIAQDKGLENASADRL